MKAHNSGHKFADTSDVGQATLYKASTTRFIS